MREKDFFYLFKKARLKLEKLVYQYLFMRSHEGERRRSGNKPRSLFQAAIRPSQNKLAARHIYFIQVVLRCLRVSETRDGT